MTGDDRERVRNVWEEIANTFAEWFEKEVKPLFQAVRKLTRSFAVLAWKSYRRAGCPLGRTWGGMIAYHRLVAAAELALQRADEERIWAMGRARLQAGLP